VRDAARRVFDRYQRQQRYSVAAMLEMATTDGSEDDDALPWDERADEFADDILARVRAAREAA
jgi:hypothetical protein